jgi:hypothetical protein
MNSIKISIYKILNYDTTVRYILIKVDLKLKL